MNLPSTGPFVIIKTRLFHRLRHGFAHGEGEGRKKNEGGNVMDDGHSTGTAPGRSNNVHESETSEDVPAGITK